MKELTKVVVYDIKRLRDVGHTQVEVALLTGCSERTVRNVLTGKHAQRDERADCHDRMLGGISSGCYDMDNEIPIFEDPTSEMAERIEFLENNDGMELIDCKR